MSPSGSDTTAGEGGDRPTDLPQSPEHLRALCSTLIAAGGLYSVIFTAAAWRSSNGIFINLTAAGVTVLLTAWGGRLLAARGNTRAGVLVCALGIVFAALWVGLFFPTLYPAAMLGAVIAVVIALPYLEGSRLLALSAVSFLCVVVVSLNGLLFPRPPEVSRGSVAAAMAVTLFFEMLVLTVSLNQFRERLRRNLAALTRAIAYREEFISIASHELRTPLTALRLQVERLRRSNLSPEQSQAAVESAFKQAGRLSGLVDSLLDVSRISSGGVQLEKGPCDLVTIVKTVMGLLSDEAKSAQCPMTLSAPGSLTGEWDALKVEQVVTNLLSNAVKYGAHAPIEVTIERSDDAAVMVVRDRGIGIAPLDQARLFAPFSRVGANQTIGGLGLGLYISRKIIQTHGGEIDLASAVGEGTSFRVRLPLGTA